MDVAVLKSIAEWASNIVKPSPNLHIGIEVTVDGLLFRINHSKAGCQWFGQDVLVGWDNLEYAAFPRDMVIGTVSNAVVAVLEKVQHAA